MFGMVMYCRCVTLRICNVTCNAVCNVTCLSFFVTVTVHAFACFLLPALLLVDQKHRIFFPIVQLHVLIQPAGFDQGLHQRLWLFLPLAGVGDRAGAALTQITVISILCRPRPQAYQKAHSNNIRIHHCTADFQLFSKLRCFAVLRQITVNLNPRYHTFLATLKRQISICVNHLRKA